VGWREHPEAKPAQTHVPWTNPAPNAGAAPDCRQRPLLRRSRFRQQVSASVRHLEIA